MEQDKEDTEKGFSWTIRPFLWFIINGIVIRIALSLVVGTAFYLARDKELIDALNRNPNPIYSFAGYFRTFASALSLFAWIAALIIMRKSLFRGLRLLFIPFELILLLLSCVSFAGTFFYGFEGECIYDPLIDTRHTDSFNPYNIPKLETGMTKEEVVELIGQPLRDTDTEMQFTGDGASPHGDFAWYDFSIALEDGKVVGIRSKWTYD